MSENLWLGGGSVYGVTFKSTAKGGVYLSFRLGVYDSFAKTTDYIQVVCFDNNMVTKLQGILQDKDYVRLEGRLKVEYKKEEKTTYVQIIANKIFFFGNLEPAQRPQMVHSPQATHAPSTKITSRDVVEGLDDGEALPF